MQFSAKLLVLAAAVLGVDAAALKAWWGTHPVVVAAVSALWTATVFIAAPIVRP